MSQARFFQLKHDKRRCVKCQEETEQDPWVRDPERAEVRVEAPAAWAGEVVLRQARAVIASAPTVGKEQPINWGPPVTSSNALSVERL